VVICGSGITADEKFKHQKNGNTHRYVYYKCTRIKDHFCPNAMINEDGLIAQLQALIDDLDIKTVPMREKITEELNRLKSLNKCFSVTKQ
jgi:hypothetical protein